MKIIKICLVLSLLFLSGCYATSEEIEMAQEKCKSFGGIEKFWPSLIGLGGEVECNDGTRITFDIK